MEEQRASCYICLDTGDEELERACDFCRGGNVVHFSCLHEYLKQTNQEEPKCPTCKQQLGPKFQVRFFERILPQAIESLGEDHRNVAPILFQLGNAYGNLGDAAKQRDLLERALVIQG